MRVHSLRNDAMCRETSTAMQNNRMSIATAKLPKMMHKSIEAHSNEMA